MTLIQKKNRILAIQGALILLIIIVTGYVEYLGYKSINDQQRYEVDQEATVINANIEELLNRSLSLTSIFRQYISANPDLTQADFDDLASILVFEDTPISRFSAYKNLSLSHTYPFVGNEAQAFLQRKSLSAYTTMISDSDSDSGQEPNIETYIIEPDGRVDLIIELAVFNQNGNFWGVLTSSLNVESILSKIRSKLKKPVSFSIHLPEYKDSEQTIILGDSTLDNKNSMRQQYAFANKSWSIFVSPENGWSTFALQPIPIGLAGTLILLILYATKTRLQNIAFNIKRTEELELSEAKFRAFFDQNSLYMMILDQDTHISQLNNAALEFYGYKIKELEGMPLAVLTSKIDETIDSSHFDITVSKKFSTQHKLANGTTKEVEIFTSPIELDGKRKIFVTIIDVTEKLKDERDRRLFEQVYEHSQEGIMVTDKDHKILAVNPAFESITGYQIKEVLSKNPSILKSGKHNERFYKDMHDDINMLGFWRGEIWNKNKSGQIYPQLVSISQVRDKNDSLTNLVAVFSDISQQKESEEKLEKLAHYDALTNLPNRLTIRLQLEQQIKVAKRRHTQCAVLFIDLDRFKIINDSLGHSSGDILLKMVGERIKSRLRDEDILGRLGGDEFVILISDYSTENDLKVIARDVCALLKRPFEINDVEANVGASIGISQYPKDATTADELINYADASMYKAKKSTGIEFIFYDSSIIEEASSKLTIKTDIKHAIEHQEFELLLQPQFNLSTNTVCGGEALIRWNHPEKGFLTPDRFINLAEETGDIKLITHWVLFEIFKLQKQWEERGLALRLSVNISARELGESALYEYLQELVIQYPGIARYVSLEIVESALVEKFDETNIKLQGLRELGFKIEIDDFGTGFSSLSYLGKLKVDALKIDKIFVQNMDSKVQGGIVKSIIALAENFDLAVVSEGIETAHHAELLLKLGCQTGQGYYFSKPISIAEFEQRFLSS